MKSFMDFRRGTFHVFCYVINGLATREWRLGFSLWHRSFAVETSSTCVDERGCVKAWPQQEQPVA